MIFTLKRMLTQTAYNCKLSFITHSTFWYSLDGSYNKRSGFGHKLQEIHRTNRSTNMKIYFNIDSIPELEDLEPAKRRIVWHSAKNEVWRNWQMWIGSILACLVGAACALGMLAALLTFLPKGILWLYFICGFFSGAIGMGLAWWLIELLKTNHIRPYLAKYIEELDTE